MQTMTASSFIVTIKFYVQELAIVQRQYLELKIHYFTSYTEKPQSIATAVHRVKLQTEAHDLRCLKAFLGAAGTL